MKTFDVNKDLTCAPSSPHGKLPKLYPYNWVADYCLGHQAKTLHRVIILFTALGLGHLLARI
jgi:hypothetical protein